MPGFSQSLQGRDLGHLRIVAQAWGAPVTAGDARLALLQLETHVLDPAAVRSVLASLPPDALGALQELAENGGRLPWAQFTRRFGEVRAIGAGKRDREQPHHQAVSAAETLWYCALAARSFFDTPAGPEEFAYIPADLLVLLPFGQAAPPEPMGRPASPEERQYVMPVSGRILDHACTLLAALRIPLPDGEIQTAAAAWAGGPLSLSPLPLTPAVLKALVGISGLLDEHGSPLPDPTRQFLESRRGEAVSQLFQTWLRSQSFDELRLIPHLAMDGGWENDPLRARQSVLGFLSALPRKTWWSLNALIADIHNRQPDFQRPAGDYDSWFIRDTRTGEYLRGFDHWYDVDGLLVRALITGPLHWLGLLDLAAPDAGSPTAAFRFSKLAGALLTGTIPTGFPDEKGVLTAGSDARIIVQRGAPRAMRYQLARFCEWDKETDENYRYRITPRSLERARTQGLAASHLLALFKRAGQPPPPSLLKALERWEQKGTEARFEHALVLRLSSPDILQALRSSKAGRFLGDPLGPTAVIVHRGAMEKVLLALSELGYLGLAAHGGEDPANPLDYRTGALAEPGLEQASDKTETEQSPPSAAPR